MIRNKVKILSVLLLVVCASGALANELSLKSVHYEEDTSPAFFVHNTGSENVTVSIYAGDAATNKVTIGSTSTTLDMSGTDDTIAEVAALIEACANSAGVKVLKVDYNCSLGADSTDDELMDNATAAVVVRPGARKAGSFWDTSVAKFYSTYFAGDNADGGDGSMRILRCIGGNIGGTGDVTVNIYRNGVEVFEHVVATSYAWSAAGTTETWAEQSVKDGQLGLNAFLANLDFPLEGGKNYLVRATRATTGTTGSIVGIVETLP